MSSTLAFDHQPPQAPPRRPAVHRGMLRSVIVGDPTTYWDAVLTPGQCATMVDKYDSLAELEGMGPGDGQVRRIRRAARRWPGSLRESQLAGPAVCDARRRAALRGANSPARTRGAWCADCPALPLWSTLHLLLGDLGRWRRQLHRGEGATSEALLSFLAEAPQSARWDPDAVRALVGGRVHVRLAYLWLAVRSGLPLLSLSRTLFVRGGRWERRADDPPSVERAALPIEIAGFFPLL